MQGEDLELAVPKLTPLCWGLPLPAQKETLSGFSESKKIYFFFPSAAPRSSQRVCEMALCNGQFQKWKLSSCEFQPRQMFWRVPELRLLQPLRGCVRTAPGPAARRRQEQGFGRSCCYLLKGEKKKRF